MKHCPYCGRENDLAAIHGPGCGTTFDQASAENSAVPAGTTGSVPVVARSTDPDFVAKVEACLGGPGRFTALEESVARRLADTMPRWEIRLDLESMGLPPALADEVITHVRHSPRARERMAAHFARRTWKGIVVFVGSLVATWASDRQPANTSR